ncbi:unnamed protein product [Parascedosporium putredinis]|uniref:Nap family protein n=1 Tax=Parascedosporium putredinis TaxID=1442378 RepID=A0A9P1M5M4_9PEZI|nr:unnamed protein product [Parascedosporium putredinis]CAI7987430.1 unnamed protein product [Parascedosporium putredinis]
MAQNGQESTVTYEELLDLEREFEDADAEIIRHQIKTTAPLFEKRAALVAKIPNFWPLVIEQAPPGVDEHIQPSDAGLLLMALTDLEVTHFELDDPEGDPRSISIKWTFGDNDYFEDKVLEKKFWYRRADKGDWAGLVSEPVDIKWKAGQDLTQGLLAQAAKVFREEQRLAREGKSDGLDRGPQGAQGKFESIGLGGISFFAWFGYVGRRVTAEESKQALKDEQEIKKLRQEGKEPPEEEPEEGEDEDDEMAIEEDLEIFPEGDDLAVSISEELWPDAIKYFTNAQEEDGLSDINFESDDEDDEDDEEAAGSPPPTRRGRRREQIDRLRCTW